MTGSVQRRLVVGAGLGLALVFVVVGLAIDVLARRALTDQFDGALAARARALAVLVEQDGAEVESDLDARVLPDLGAGSGLWIELTVDGEPRYRSAPTRPARAGTRATQHRFAPRQDDGAPAPPRAAVLTVVQSTAALDDAVAGVRTALALAGLVGLALCLGVLAWLGRFAVAPLHRLADDIGAVDESDLSAGIDASRAPAELRVVVERLNALLARVEAAFARERELTAEIAHELRTPLAGITATVEVALDRAREPARYQAALREIHAIAGQTHQLVEALLTLARLDAGAHPIAADEVEIGELIADALDRIAPAAAARDLRIVSALAAAPVRTDRALLAIVVANLLDNAVAHADAGGRVEVAVTSAGRIRIANTGSQIAADDVARVGQRFWRGDHARAVGAHAGLGLALCHKIAAVLGARLGITSARGGEFVVEVEL